MTKSFFCTIDNATAEIPKHFYPHARYKSDPSKYAGKWRFKAPNAKSSTDINNFIDRAPDKIGVLTLIEISKELYHKHYPDMLIDDSKIRIDRGSLLYQFNKFKPRYEGNESQNWTDVESACMRFCEAVGNIPLNQLDYYALQESFDYFKPNTQKKMKACMSKFFKSHLFKFDLVPKITDNPFIVDTRCSLEYASIKKATTHRERMLFMDLREIMAQANKNDETRWAVDALKISFLTGLRCADVVGLRWEDYDKKLDEIIITINKSFKASEEKNKHIRLLLTAESHPEVMRIIKRRALSRRVLIHEEKTYYNVKQKDAVYEVSDYVFNRRPKYIHDYIPGSKTQHTQITANFYSRTFKELSDQCPNINKRQKKKQDYKGGVTTLHEIRSLFARTSAVKGFSMPDIKDCLAHQREGRGPLENAYLNGILIKPLLMVTLADLNGGEIDEKKHKIKDLEIEQMVGTE